MTRDILKKATELNNRIKQWESAKAELEEMKNKCWGNATEVWARNFYVMASEGTKDMKVDVSARSAMAALDAEIKGVSKELEEMEEEFRELH